ADLVRCIVTRRRPALFRGRHFEDVISGFGTKHAGQIGTGAWTRRTLRSPGSWAYLYRAVDSAGETSEFMLSPKRDLTAAKLFLRLALSRGVPRLPAVSLPNRDISAQHHRAEPSLHQKADCSEPWVSVGRGR